MLDCWPTTECEIISQKNYERLFRGWRRLFIGGLKERMHRNRQNGQLHALQREAGRLKPRSIEIPVAVRHPSSIHLPVIEQKAVPETIFSFRELPHLMAGI
jgi:hypothetical protein